MVADYKNWMPKGMILGTAVADAAAALLCLLVPFKSVQIASGLLCLILFAAAGLMFTMYHAFDYHGKRQMSRQIIEGLAGYVTIPEGGKCLDIGCGSGALSIACAKRNPKAQITGLDRWGKKYASFSQKLCEQNAVSKGVANVRFVHGDAVSLDFPDESFDAVTSNYVYHNIPSKNRQDILRETLRLLKKDGTFAIHDIFSKAKYGNMNTFVKELRKAGFREVRLIPTTEGLFMSHLESVWMGLGGSALLVGRK